MYERYFRLREPPFNLTPNPRFLFMSRSCREAFATISYGIAQRKGLIAITGEAGTGKTSLLKVFLQSAGPSLHAACVLDPRLSFTELMACAFDAFGVADAGAGRAAALARLKEFLLAQSASDHRVVFLLDEAQGLSDEVLEELRLISDFEAAGARLLQIVLVGQPQLEARLDQPPHRHLKQRVALWSRLEPLEAGEVRPYIEFRLGAAGYDGPALFTPAALGRTAAYSQGVPRLVNVICDNGLLTACATGQSRVGADIIDEVAAELDLAAGDFAGEPAPAKERATIASARYELPAQAIAAPPAMNSESFAPVRAEIPGAPAPLPQIKEKRWAGLGAAMAVLLGVFAIAQSFSARTAVDAGYFSPVAENFERIRQVFAPLPGRIYRVLMTRSGRKAGDAGDFTGRAPMAEAQARRVEVAPPSKTEKRAPPLKRRGETLASLGSRRGAPPAARDFVHRDTPAPREARKLFDVVANSFVRAAPSAKAAIVATLRPGAHIRLLGRTGEYWRVQSTEDKIHGYVHKEDAFFEPAR